jgi:hypothetical protein
MFGRKTASLNRSSSIGQKLSFNRSSPSSATSSPQQSQSPATKLRAQSVDQSGIVVIDDDSDDAVGSVSATEFNLLRIRLNHLERRLESASDPNEERVSALFADMEKLKAEATRLGIKFEENLTSLQKQRSLMESLLASHPDETVFPTSNIKVRVGEQVFHTSLRFACQLYFFSHFVFTFVEKYVAERSKFHVGCHV